MRSRNILRAFLMLLPLFLFSISAVFAADEYSDTRPVGTSRVARISLIKGEVQIKRNDGRDWEQAVNNLPLVEGDQITTGENSRLEIQFDTYNYVRLAENSSLKLTTLRDEGIAVSLPRGILNLRVTNFNSKTEYFEMDAPKTTFSVEKNGSYRIDASRDRNNGEVRITVTEGGRARVYSDNSGFTVKDGRSARIFLDGNNEGEWETTTAQNFADDFDSWVIQREAILAKRIDDRNRSNNKYYDDDIVGADELSDYGEWVYTKNYGYVWRPYRTNTARYADWKPYRHGNWRWCPPYGYVWIGDEPWSWSTYHYGRWVYESGDWCWTPYTYNRGHSWWHPAYVVITYSGSSICWYPAPYYSDNYYYSSYYHHGRRGGNTTIINNNTTIINNGATPTPTPVNADIDPRRGGNGQLPRVTPTPVTGGQILGIDPPRGSNGRLPSAYNNAVTGMKSDEFGRGRGFIIPISADTAQEVLQNGNSLDKGVQRRPTGIDSDSQVKGTILANTPIFRADNTKIGAADRKVGVKMDDELRTEKIYGNRQTIQRDNRPLGISGKAGSDTVETSDTGAVSRPASRPVERRDDRKDDSSSEPIVRPKNDSSGEPIVRPKNDDSTGSGNRDENNSPRKPARQPINRDDENQSPPIINTQRDEERKPRYDPPPREEKPREEPRRESPPERKPEPRSEPRYDPPAPRNDPAPRSEPKSEPKSDPPAKEPPPSKDNKDGRE